MNDISRIPPLAGTSIEDARAWFIAMRDAVLLFHPEEDAADIIDVRTHLPIFSPEEAAEANAVLFRLFEALGDGVIEACYPIFMQPYWDMGFGVEYAPEPQAD